MQASEHSLTALALNKIFVTKSRVIDKIKGQVSTFDIKLVCLIHMRKA